MTPPRARDLPFWAALLTALLLVGLYALNHTALLHVPFFDDAEHDFVDWRFRHRGPRPPADDRILIVALDDETRARAPEIFQRRAGWARLLEAIVRGNPRVVAVDAFFSSPELVLSKPTVLALEQARTAALALPSGSEAITAALDAALDETRGDDKLTRAIAAAPHLLLAGLFLLDRDPAPAGAGEPAGLIGARYEEAASAPAPASRRPPQAAELVVLTRGAMLAPSTRLGFVNKHADPDGVTRRAYLVIERAGRFYAPLGLRAAADASGEALSYLVGDDEVRIGERRLPVDARGQAWLGFLGPRGSFPIVSAADVLGGQIPPERFAGKIVFVGYADAARDQATTPFDTTFYGVELHATLADNALSGQLYRGASPRATLALVVAAALLAALLQVRALRRRTWLPPVLAAALLAGYVVTAVQLFDGSRVILPVVWPAVTLLLVVFAGVSTAVVVEGFEKARIRSAFAQYLDERAVKQLLADPSLLRLGGERRELTALFSDIRGFTAISEKLEPEQVISFLNEYLTPMTEVVWETGGLLDKYIGDAVMAVYGAPLEQTDHARRACTAALAMQERLASLNQGWDRVGLPRLAIGIGLNTGPMSVGNMGSERRKNYTVVGDAVNLASRLEGLTKAYDVPILCTERTAELAGDGFVFRELDLVRAKGRDQATRVLALVGLRGAVVPAEWPDALAAYRARDWERADALLTTILAAHPEDGPSLGLRARIAAHRVSPPPEDWDGAFDQDAK